MKPKAARAMRASMRIGIGVRLGIIVEREYRAHGDRVTGSGDIQPIPVSVENGEIGKARAPAKTRKPARLNICFVPTTSAAGTGKQARQAEETSSREFACELR
jgi:hypothetical protein